MTETYFLTLKSVPMTNKGKVFAYTHFPYVEPFNESLEALQEQVGGLIEHFIIDESLNDRRIDMWIDDEGKLKGHKPTFLLCDKDGNPLDAIVGNCVFTKYDGDGNTFGLSQEDINIVMSWLGTLPFVPVHKNDDESLEYAFVVKGFGG